MSLSAVVNIELLLTLIYASMKKNYIKYLWLDNKLRNNLCLYMYLKSQYPQIRVFMYFSFVLKNI